MVSEVAEALEFQVVARRDGGAALAEASAIKPDAVIADLSEFEATTVLRELAAADPQCPVILMARGASVDAAIEALKAGALDYLAKPFDRERLREVLVTVRKRVERRETLLRIDADLAKQFEFYGMVGRSPAMQELFDTIRRLAPHLRTVLITGETGTGKELVAKALHRLGPRRDKRLVTLNCSAVVETLFESELFGHVRGAFTGANETKVGLFEHADTGTIFLDEVGELPMSLQAKLLRAVEYGEVQRVGALETRNADVCIIAATNRDLLSEVADGRFRSDLYYRLGILELYLVPLRERREDIPYLAAVFIRECSQRVKRPIIGMTAAAERRAADRAMARQCPSAAPRHRARVFDERRPHAQRTRAADGDVGGDGRRRRTRGRVTSSGSVTPKPLSSRLSAAQRDQIERVLTQVGGNKTAAAHELGISRRSLYRWIDRLNIQ